jgi:hypothetical protein
MSLPNDSIANLLVTRKSLDASDNRTPLAWNLGCAFPVPFREAGDRKTGARNGARKKKPALQRRRRGPE